MGWLMQMLFEEEDADGYDGYNFDERYYNVGQIQEKNAQRIVATKTTGGHITQANEKDALAIQSTWFFLPTEWSRTPKGGRNTLTEHWYGEIQKLKQIQAEKRPLDIYIGTDFGIGTYYIKDVNVALQDIAKAGGNGFVVQAIQIQVNLVAIEENFTIPANPVVELDPNTGEPISGTG